MRVGVLALQGDVREHVRLLKEIGADPVAVKTREALDDVEGIVLPGGESTTIGFLLEKFELMDPLRKRIEDGMPTLGTCAGAILLASRIDGGDVPKLGVLDATMHRNAYGTQIESFEDDVDVEGAGTMHAVFIRAPIVEGVGEGVEVLATCRERPVVVRQGNVIAATFHPELADETGLHRMLLT